MVLCGLERYWYRPGPILGWSWGGLGAIVGDFGAVLGVGSAAKVVSKRSRGTSHENKFMLVIVFVNSIGADLQKY